MRFLFIPGNNSLSHAAKCLVIREKLIAKGHECLIAITKSNSHLLKNLGCDHVILPDIQEVDGAGFPSISWFSDRQQIIKCINAEIDLLNEYKPDRVVGVFRFTSKISAQLAGVPFDSLTCGCMTPYSQHIMGVADDEHKTSSRKDEINMFFRSAALKFNNAISHLSIDRINDIRETLIGDRTFLWDFPEFSPVTEKSGLFHVGPLSWSGWPYDALDINTVINGGSPLAVITFGTCAKNIAIIKRLITILRDIGYRIFVAGGGQLDDANLIPEDRGVYVSNFAPLQRILPYSSLIVAHGGQMTIFEALFNKVPIIVMPFQPEQAHNGICLERIGCGRLLVPSRTFVGSSGIYTDALDLMKDKDIKSAILSLVDNHETMRCLSNISDVLKRYNGPELMASFLEQEK